MKLLTDSAQTAPGDDADKDMTPVIKIVETTTSPLKPKLSQDIDVKTLQDSIDRKH